MPIWAVPESLWLGFVHNANLKLMESGMTDIGKENETEEVVTKHAIAYEGSGDNGYVSIFVTSLLSTQINRLLE